MKYVRVNSPCVRACYGSFPVSSSSPTHGIRSRFRSPVPYPTKSPRPSRLFRRYVRLLREQTGVAVSTKNYCWSLDLSDIKAVRRMLAPIDKCRARALTRRVRTSGKALA
ncbi:UNVERIFIED_CONTAM: hypothetical protein RMT77_019361 [Armadillidium vulgare]